MKLYDKVKIIRMDSEYKKDIEFLKGTIIQPEIRDERFYVAFSKGEGYLYQDVKINDLEVVEEGWGTDEVILEELPQKNPKWWCKVEDGFILNLLGEKKNKIPYDYNS